LLVAYRSHIGLAGTALAAAMMVPMPARAATETVLHNFVPPPNGANPYGGVIRDSQGNLHGTAYNGGAWNHGVVFKVNAAGKQTVLYSFTGRSDGDTPFGGVVEDSAGNLYGTTIYGGASGDGVVFKVTPTGQETVLHSFAGGSDGVYPYAGVVLDSEGNAYGTTAYGGMFGRGVVYKVGTTGQETVLYSFTGFNDGGQPQAGVTRDLAGNLYGTTINGGAWGYGTVYKLNASGEETVLYSFPEGTNGAYPYTGVVRDSAGNLYGTAATGGQFGYGLVYQVSPDGRETVLHSFSGGTDGMEPDSGLLRDSAGDLYGVTFAGGAGFGTVYKIDASGQETVLYSFTGGADGRAPWGGLVEDPAGNLYGATAVGGGAGYGVVFQLNSSGRETVLYSFPWSDGFEPYAGVIRDSAGNLFGTTLTGGASGAGAVYKITAAGTETILYSFSGGVDGGSPLGGLVLDAAGYLFGTTYEGGTGSAGVVFSVNATGRETVLHSFTGSYAWGPDGYGPQGSLARNAAGNLYGTTYYGGSNGYGTVYEVSAAGQETVLYSFVGGLDAARYPSAGVTLDSAGNIYGTTQSGGEGFGAVYRLDSAGNETLLHSFVGGTDGAIPFAGLVRDSAGNLYGTTTEGGPSNLGVVYQVDPAGLETVLYAFTGGADGANPQAGLVRDSAGNLFGTTYAGGAADAGVVFEVAASGRETVLYSFTGGADGGNPVAGLFEDPEGNLYGTTTVGGTHNGGVVFRIAQ